MCAAHHIPGQRSQYLCGSFEIQQAKSGYPGLQPVFQARANAVIGKRPILNLSSGPQTSTDTIMEYFADALKKLALFREEEVKS